MSDERYPNWLRDHARRLVQNNLWEVCAVAINRIDNMLEIHFDAHQPKTLVNSILLGYNLVHQGQRFGYVFYQGASNENELRKREDQCKIIEFYNIGRSLFD